MTLTIQVYKYKNHYKGDIGMANYEKRVEQEAAYPIPISLYNCYRRETLSRVYSYASLLMPHCPVTVVQRYRDGICSLLFHLFFIICHPYIPLHLEEMIFILVILLFGCAIYNIGAKKRFALYTCNYHFLLHYLPSLLIPFFSIIQHAGIERYNATLLTSKLCCTIAHSAYYHNTCARGRSRQGTLSKIASFIVDS